LFPYTTLFRSLQVRTPERRPHQLLGRARSQGSGAILPRESSRDPPGESFLFCPRDTSGRPCPWLRRRAQQIQRPTPTSTHLRQAMVSSLKSPLANAVNCPLRNSTGARWNQKPSRRSVGFGCEIVQGFVAKVLTVPYKTRRVCQVIRAIPD